MIGRCATLIAAACAALGATATPTGPAHAQSVRQLARITNCTDPRGERVTAVAHARLPNVGMAGRVRGRPVILINPHILRKFRPATRIFWFFHECAHHALGHSLGHQPLSRERDADCWAIRQMRRRGLLTAARLRTIQEDLYPLAGDGYLYLPGPQRAAHVGYCATGRSAPPRMARRRAAPGEGYASRQRRYQRRVDESRRFASGDDRPSEGPVTPGWRRHGSTLPPGGSGAR